MVRIIYGDVDSEKYVFNPDVFFNNNYEEEWITESLSMQMILAVDDSKVLGTGVIDSPYLGLIPVERLSRGVKTLILMEHDSEHIFNASACGDNCAPWILKIGQEKDLVIRLGYLMDFGKGAFDIEIVNLRKIVHSMRELIETVLDHHLL